MIVVGAVALSLHLFAPLCIRLVGVTVVNPGPVQLRVDRFADLLGFPASKPRDSIRITISINPRMIEGQFVPESLLTGHTPVILWQSIHPAPLYVERQVTITMEHNGMNGPPEPWTPLSREQQNTVLKKYGSFLAEQFPDSDVSRLIPGLKLDHVTIARAALHAGTPDTLDRRVLWSNILAYIADHFRPRITIPIAFVTLLAGAALWLSATRRNPDGTCRHCGYDLSATPTKDHCPECGKSTLEGYGPIDSA